LEEWNLLNVKEAYPRLWEFLKEAHPDGRCTTQDVYDAATWLWNITETSKADDHLARMVRYGFFTMPQKGVVKIEKQPRILTVKGAKE